MRRGTIVLCFAAAAAMAACAIYWLTPRPVRTIVVVGHSVATEPTMLGLRRGLQELGWREDESIHLAYSGALNPAALREWTNKMVNGRTALVVALSTPAALVARDIAAPLGVPVLLVPSSDPVSAGLVSGTTHPGEAVTGIAVALHDPRRLEMFLRLVPGARRIWVPFDHSDPGPAAAFKRLRAAADKLDVTVVPADIRSAPQLHEALDPLPRNIDAIFLPQDAMLASHIHAIVAAAAARGIPVTSPSRNGVSQGAVFSYGFDLYALGRQSARLADQILSGTPANDLPIETADLEMTVNLSVADYLHLAVPDDMLRHASIVGRAGE